MKTLTSALIRVLPFSALALAATANASTPSACPDLSGGWSGKCRDERGQTSPGDFIFVQNSCSDLYLNNHAVKVPSSYARLNGTRAQSGSVAWLDGQVLQQVDSVQELDGDGTVQRQTTTATTFTRYEGELDVTVHTVTSQGDSGNAAAEATLHCVVTAVPTR